MYYLFKNNLKINKLVDDIYPKFAVHFSDNKNNDVNPKNELKHQVSLQIYSTRERLKIIHPYPWMIFFRKATVFKIFPERKGSAKIFNDLYILVLAHFLL